MRLSACYVVAFFSACTPRPGVLSTTAEPVAPVDSPLDSGVVSVSPCHELAAPTLDSLGALSTGRYSPSAAIMGDGRVIVAGGFDFHAHDNNSSDLIDVAAGSVESGPLLGQARNFGTTAVLANGTIAVTGGFNSTLGSLSTIELLPRGGSAFQLLPDQLHEVREAHTATALPIEGVVMAGGLSAVGLRFRSSIEVWDSNGLHTLPVHLSTARAFHAAEYVPALRALLIVGGDTPAGPTSSVELLTFDSHSVETLGDTLRAPAKALASVTLQDGTVLIAGGANGSDGTLAQVALFDPKTKRLTPRAPMTQRRMAFALSLLDDGRVLASGGWSDSLTPAQSNPVLEVYDPLTDVWTQLGVSLRDARHDHAAIALSGCRVLIAGGQHVIGTGAPDAPRALELLRMPPRADQTGVK